MTVSSHLCLCMYTRQCSCSVTARPRLLCLFLLLNYNRPRLFAWGSSEKSLTLTYIAHCSYTILSSTILLCNVSIHYAAHVFMYMLGCVHVWVCVCLGVCMFGCVHVWVCACLGVCMCMDVDVDVDIAWEMNRLHLYWPEGCLHNGQGYLAKLQHLIPDPQSGTVLLWDN